jgi:ATP-dependent Zn protease
MNRAARILRIAYHEAGHAVVALALGYVVTSVRIDDEDDGGRVRYRAPDYVSDAHPILLSIAGHAAEQLRYSSNTELSSAAKADERRWLELVAHLPQTSRDTYVRKLHMQARSLLRLNWAAVEALAAALFEHRSVSHSQIRKVVGQVHQWGGESDG